MTDKTEAQRLADWLLEGPAESITPMEQQAAACISRQEAENAALRDLLGRIVGNHDASLRTLVKMNGGQPVNISLHGEQADNVKEILGLMAEARAALSGTAPARTGDAAIAAMKGADQ